MDYGSGERSGHGPVCYRIVVRGEVTERFAEVLGELLLGGRGVAPLRAHVLRRLAVQYGTAPSPHRLDPTMNNTAIHQSRGCDWRRLHLAGSIVTEAPSKWATYRRTVDLDRRLAIALYAPTAGVPSELIFGVLGMARAKNRPDNATSASTLRADRSPSTRAWSLASIASAATSGDTPA
jgi:hypothetical protein